MRLPYTREAIAVFGHTVPKYAGPYWISTVFLTLVTWNTASANTSGKFISIRTAAQYNTEPKFVVMSNGRNAQVVGLCIDIHRALERTDRTLSFTGDQNVLPASRVEASLVSGVLEAACGFSRTPRREAKLFFLDPPLFSVNYYLAVRANDPIFIRNWDDVRSLGKDGTVLVSHGFAPASRLRESEYIDVDSGGTSTESNLKKLMAGRGRFYYHRSPGIEAEISRFGLDARIKVLPTVMDSQQFYLVLGPFVAEETRQKIERALGILSANGELTDIKRKWIQK
ncbi:substrate-binding periplasmic protein [Herbaspirillum sp. GCM10030257]|uniref:substrate-binding periplasmic protein n=1 Tax=Herbaspirillum sp. GCM10030257 TaxID=3273393 RepID=UPI003621CCD0